MMIVSYLVNANKESAMRRFNTCGLIALLLASVSPLSGQTISVSGTWDLVIGPADLVSGMPGDNLNSTYENTAGDVMLSFGTGGSLFNSRDYRIDVQRSDSNWYPTFQLAVRRTSGGFVWGSINGGTSYQNITSAAQQFVYGRAWFGLNVPLQYRLTGVSAAIPADTYVTTVIYTITAW